MTLDTFLQSIKDKRKPNDLLYIYAEETLNNGDKINLTIDNEFINKHPLILQADLLDYGEEDTEESDFFAKSTSKIKVYYAQVSLDQYNKAKKGI